MKLLISDLDNKLKLLLSDNDRLNSTLAEKIKEIMHSKDMTKNLERLLSENT